MNDPDSNAGPGPGNDPEFPAPPDHLAGLAGMDLVRRALEEAIQIYPEAVIATPGGLVSDAASFNLLLAHCTTVWLQAEPEDHMRRVTAQGDMRPMAASKEAMQDLKGILNGRAPFYSKAQLSVNTSAQPLDATFELLRRSVRQGLQMQT